MISLVDKQVPFNEDNNLDIAKKPVIESLLSSNFHKYYAKLNPYIMYKLGNFHYINYHIYVLVWLFTSANVLNIKKTKKTKTSKTNVTSEHT